MANRTAIAAVMAGLLVAGCSSRGEQRRALPAPTDEPAEPVAKVVAPVAEPIDAGPPLGEAAARELLARRFRAAGYRVRYDVRIRGADYDVTLDGYDPAKQVGYEYIDPVEAGTDVTPAERHLLINQENRRLLILEAADQPTIERRAENFLETVVKSAN